MGKQEWHMGKQEWYMGKQEWYMGKQEWYTEKQEWSERDECKARTHDRLNMAFSTGKICARQRSTERGIYDHIV